MSKSVNQCLIIGNVGKDPEVRTLDNGTKVVQFSVATSTGGYKRQDGTEVAEVTQWHSIVAWRNLAEIAERYVRKGDKVVVQGQINYRKYTAKDGSERYATDIQAYDIVLQSSKGDGKSQITQSEEIPTPVSISTGDDLPF